MNAVYNQVQHNDVPYNNPTIRNQITGVDTGLAAVKVTEGESPDHWVIGVDTGLASVRVDQGESPDPSLHQVTLEK